ncbi:uncharacterized protein YjbI with pentapeptide repeats [Tenacibaculum skagerrakense]|uniref:Uncharacterized protein YjbI with pentapeptide repeats n=1 Tax=Tenacibaculum skagerrakense TaxID=186571 RepID=A0A4R2NL80_9FLAO|nr:hypothetical protein [Tenacibaculum skagerrakense]TCP22172.1 uncharacterized protein YjbI with pentapeptide repeats [Tenacibaculum skagerrakense]
MRITLQLFVVMAMLCTTFSYSQTLNETSGTGSGVNITSGDFNTMYGDSTGSFLTSGSQTVFIGYQAGRSNTTSESVFIGYQAGYSNTTGFDNTFVGWQAGRLTTTGGDNTFFGAESGELNTTGYDNTFVGEESGANNTTGYENTFIGEDAGFSNTTGYKNTFVGNEAGISSGTGFRNTGIGDEALSDVTTGDHNTALGDSAGIDVNAGRWNTFIGAASGVATEHADYNTFVGGMSGWDNNRTNSTTNANRNTYVGFQTGFSNREGEDNVGMGAFSDYNNTVRSRTTFIGAAMDVDNNDVTMIGYSGYNNAQYSISIGQHHDMRGTGAIGLGYESNLNANSNYSVGIGYQVDVNENNAIAIGQQATINSEHGMGLGFQTTVDGTYSVAIGYQATAAVDSTMVLGGTVHPLSVGIGTNTPNKKASLELADTDKGFKINSLTNAQRTALASNLTVTEEGMMVYDNEDNALYTWSGSAWAAVDTDTGDNLGNHTATTTVNLANNDVNNSGNFEINDNKTLTFDGGGFGSNRYQLKEVYTTETENAYGPITSAGGSLRFNSPDLGVHGFTWGPEGLAPTAALSSNGNFQIAGYLNIAGAYQFPTIDGTSTQVLATNGSGTLSWVDNTDDQKVDEFTLSSNTLSLSLEGDAEAAKTVDLSGYLDNTDSQDLTLSGSTLSLTNDATSVDLSSFLDNTDAQTLSFSGTSLTIANGNSVDLSSLQDGTGTDNQDLDLSGNTLSLTNDATSVDLSSFLDNTDAQSISLSTNTLSISGNASTVDLSGYLDNTDAQAISLSTNTLSISGNASTVDLSTYLDNTDAQTLTLSGSNLTIANGNTVDLSGIGGTNTDNQDLTLSGNTLSLTNDATSVDLSGFLDNTDAQTLTLSGNNLTIANGNTVDLSGIGGTNTDNQDLTLSGNTLSLTNDATSVDLSGYLDNTDAQTLTLSGNNLTIANGNTVDLSAYTNTDSQNLTSATLSGTTLTVAIENGASVNVDLSPLLTAQQAQINDLISRVESIESCACGGTLSSGGGLTAGRNQPILYQNIPNPFNGTTSIKYYVPETMDKAAIVFSNTSGQVIDTVHLNKLGEQEIYFNSSSLPVGVYYYTLYIRGHKVDTKKMVIE